MNRRGFIARLAGVVGIALVGKEIVPNLVQVAKGDVLPTTSDANSTKKVPTQCFYPEIYDLRQYHQEQINKWLRKKIDEAAFNVMTRGKL